MKLLLDTNALIWWFNDDPRLGPQTKSLIANPRVAVSVSVASFWEISIKHRLGKLDDCGSELMSEVQQGRFSIIAITAQHLELLECLPLRPEHKDPFDHIILVQAQATGAILVTSDQRMRDYDVQCL